MDIDPELDRLLAPTATNAERVRGLLMVGIAPAVIAFATRSSASSLRNWSIGDTQPRHEAAIILDDLRITTRTLLEALEPERVVQWFTSRDPDRFGGMRPFEMIAIDPMEVLAAAHATVLATEARAPKLALVGCGAGDEDDS
jgi:hypothetical protein